MKYSPMMTRVAPAAANRIDENVQDLLIGCTMKSSRNGLSTRRVRWPPVAGFDVTHNNRLYGYERR